MDATEVKGAVDELNSTWKAFREEHEKLLAQGKNTQKEWTEKLQALGDRMDQIEVKLKRPPVIVPGAGQMDEQAAARKQAFLTFCRYGLEGITPEQKALLVKPDAAAEKKALSTAQGVEFLASPEITNDILKGVIEYSPIRSVARVRTTGAKSVKMRKRTGVFSASWIAKMATRTETTGLTYGMEDVPNHELYALVDIPFEDLEDSDFNLETELNMEVAEQFGVAEGKSAILGDGVGEMEGIATHGDLQTAASKSGSASAVTADGMIDHFFSLKDAYARNAVWLMRRATIGVVRKLKGSDNNYLWQPGLSESVPGNILGRPYVECVDMPAIAGGAYPIAFGDFRRGYVLIDRIAISMTRDPYTQQASGMVRFHARKRVGGQVINTEAIKLQKIAT